MMIDSKWQKYHLWHVCLIVSKASLALVCRYLQGKAQLLYPEPRDVFPCELIDSEVCRPPTSYL